VTKKLSRAKRKESKGQAARTREPLAEAALPRHGIPRPEAKARQREIDALEERDEREEEAAGLQRPVVPQPKRPKSKRGGQTVLVLLALVLVAGLIAFAAQKGGERPAPEAAPAESASANATPTPPSTMLTAPVESSTPTILRASATIPPPPAANAATTATSTAATKPAAPAAKAKTKAPASEDPY
jgi:hypothetical protein